MNDQDKSKQELIEELVEIRRQEAQWRSLFATMPGFVALVDRAGTIQYLNHTAPGYCLEDTLGKNACDFIEPGCREVARKCIERVFDTGQAEFYEAVAAGSHDSISSYETFLFPVKEGDQVVAVRLVSNDVTQRKRAEEALVEAQEVARLGFYVLDIAAGRWTSSPVLDRVFGIPADYEKTIDGWAHLVHPDERQEILDHLFKEVVREKKPCDREYRIVRYGDKQVRWIHGLGRLQFNSAGKPVALLGTIQDITERKLTEEALQKAHCDLEQRVKDRTAELATANERLDIFRRFAEYAEDGFGMSDFDGRIVYANPTLCRLCGEKPEEIIGKPVFTYFPEEYKQRRRDELIPALLREGHLHIEHALLPRHGKRIQVLQSTFLIRDKNENPFRIAVVINDITDRKEAEQKRLQAQEWLKESETRYRELIDNQGEGLAIVDPQECFTFANPAAEHIFGVARGSLVGRSLRDFTTQDQFAQVLEQTMKRQAGEQSTYELEIVRPSGETRHLLVNGVPRIDRAGKVVETFGLFFDITDRKQAEEALAIEHRNLKHLLHASDHERQLIAYEIHDGLAQELAGAIMQFEAFDHLKGTRPKQAADAYQAAMTMLRQGHGEARRLIAGVRPPILDEEGIVAAVGHLVNEQIRLRGPKIEYLSRVEFDRLDPTLENAIYRIAQEALTNACQHSKSKQVSVGLTQREDRLRIEIRDWGVGFDGKDVLKNHFGLEGIRQRARLLGGKCRIKSAAGKGTHILVELPVVPRDEEA